MSVDDRLPFAPPGKAPPAPMTREASLLDEFDDDELPAPPPARVDVDIDLDIDSSEGDGFDEPEPTATRPVSTPRQTVQQSVQQTVQQAVQRRVLDSEESDLLAALGDDSPPPPAGDDFGFDDDDGGFGGSATSVNANDDVRPSALPFGALPGRVPSPAQRHLASNVDNTSAHPVAATRQEQPQVTDDDFDDGKTRALVVDEALLARLKLGDAQEAPPAPAVVAPTTPAPPTIHVEDLDLDVAAADVQPARADNDLASMLDDEPYGFDDDDAAPAPSDDAFNPSSTLALPPEPVAAFDDALADHAADVHAARLASLIEREHELLTELQAVQAELASLRANVPPPRPTRAAPARPVSSVSPVSSVPSAPAANDHFAAVGASDEGAPQWDTRAAAAAASLPSMASVDVHEVRSRVDDAFGSGHSSMLDAFDDDAPAPAIDNDDDVVSLAALQGALKEMGVDLGDGNATQVAAAIPFPLPADAGDDGDVFGSGMGSLLPGRVERTPPPASSAAASELSVEATRVRQARPAAIGLVVEDERARQRLRKYLVDRFAELFEAEDATEAMQQRSFGDVDAIVFIRPSDTERTNRGFSRLEAMPRRPRVLVISTDERFDDSPAVDLRLPLAQKASEVARQVLEGLERLGVQTSAL